MLSMLEEDGKSSRGESGTEFRSGAIVAIVLYVIVLCYSQLIMVNRRDSCCVFFQYYSVDLTRSDDVCLKEKKRKKKGIVYRLLKETREEDSE